MKKLILLFTILFSVFLTCSCANNVNDFFLAAGNINLALSRSAFTSSDLAEGSQPITVTIYKYSNTGVSSVLQSETKDMTSDSVIFTFSNITVETQIVVNIEATITLVSGEQRTYTGSSATILSPYYTVVSGENYIPVALSLSKEKYTITYHIGTLAFADEYLPVYEFTESDELILPSESNFVLPAATYAAYSFVGWYLNEGFYGDSISTLKGSDFPRNIDLYARYGIIIDDSSMLSETISDQSSYTNQRFIIDCGIDDTAYSNLLTYPLNTVHFDLKDTELTSGTYNTYAILDGYTMSVSSTQLTFLQSIILPDILTEITEGTFKASSSLSFVAIPASVKVIQQNAFFNCSPSLHFCLEWTGGWYYLDNSDGSYDGVTSYSGGTYIEDISTLLTDTSKIYIFYHS